MSHKVSISVPYNYVAISSAANMLTKLAEDIKEEMGAPSCDGSSYTQIPDRTVGMPETIAEPEAPSPEVFRTPLVQEVADSSDVAPEFIPAAPAPVNTFAATGVELDAAGLPWNGRIHAQTKTKDVNGYWKYLRGVDREGLVPMVEAELRAMMGTPVEDTPPAPVAPVADVPTPPAPPAPPAPAAPVATSAITTFAQLVTAITSNGVDEARVNEALAAVNVANFALLGARPDLIPTVAGRLGL